MAQQRASKQDPWRVAFAAALVAFAASLVVLAFSIAQAMGESGASARELADATATTAATAAAQGTAAIPTTLSYAGPLPAQLADAHLAPAQPGTTPDVSFEASTEAEMVVSGYFVPVAALGAGVDSLTRAQLDDLLAGRVTDWSKVGGVAGDVTYVTAGPESDRAAIAALTNNAVAAQTFATYDDLKAALTLDSGLLALIPIDEVTVSMSAIAIDGVDLVRGRGDATAWPFVQQTPLRALTKTGQAALASLTTALTATPPKVTHIVATGDILQSRCSLAQIEATGDWAAALRGPVGDYLAGRRPRPRLTRWQHPGHQRLLPLRAPGMAQPQLATRNHRRAHPRRIR